MDALAPRRLLAGGRTPRAGRRSGGFTLLDLLLAAVVVIVASMAGVMHVTRAAQTITRSRESAFARQRATSLVAELRASVEADDAAAAALDDYDDGGGYSPVLTITPDPTSPTGLLDADHPLSGNFPEGSEWTWYRRIVVRPVADAASRDLRMVSVYVFKNYRRDMPLPGERMAEVSSVVRTTGDSYVPTQVYDLYLVALENTPGWWVSMDAIQPFFQGALQDLTSRNPGLEFRTHWITKSGFGRDDEYAPYTNDQVTSTAPTPWTYVYPGRMPAGQAASRYYVPTRFTARVNVDGTTTASFANDYSVPEPYTDSNANGVYDDGEAFTDADGDAVRDAGNVAPYALADVHNHCKRWPEEKARFDQRVAAGLEVAEAPTWRLLLDRMISEPSRFHNAIVVNLHGELLPMPAVRNYSDAARDPELRPGWRVVTHPELLRPARVAGSDAATQAPRFRVYAYKSEMVGTATLTTPTEPWTDVDRDGAYDAGEPFVDWNGNGAYDAGLPITLTIPGGDFSTAPNAATNPSIVVRSLPGGIDSDGNGTAEDYTDWAVAPRFPESFTDSNGNGIREVVETYFDLNGNGARDAFDPYQEVDGNGTWTATTETLADTDGDGNRDIAAPEEPWTDTIVNGRWDAAEPYWDRDGNGVWTPPTAPKTPYVAWNPAHYTNPGQTNLYIRDYGEPFRDLNGSRTWTPAEAYTDFNQNGRWDAGVRRGQMWCEVSFDAAQKRTVVTLHNTPLETPATSSTRGLPAASRLYDLDYVPCPTPSTSTGTDRFARDLFEVGTFPKNTARWIVELPAPAMRRAFESTPGANNGDVQDRIIAVETRLGRDLTTGTLWPTRSKPTNLSRTYAYFHASASTVPFSERHQFLGDPRHCPYADTDRQGTTASNGYNWCFDDFNATTNEQSRWLAFDPARLQDRWLGRGSAQDVPRLMSWLRSALASGGVVYTTLTGFSNYYLSVGGDVGADNANGFPNSIPMDGTPFGLTGPVNENTLTDGSGTSTIRGSVKYVRSNAGNVNGIRSGGYWWSKPWLGELCPDTAYITQWAANGNLRAANSAASGTFRLIRRADVPASQQPAGTVLANAYGRLGEEGSTSFFNIGTSASTFHHQYEDGDKGTLIEDGPQLAQNYGMEIPSSAGISRPFGLATSAAGGVGSEFAFTDAYPRYSAQFVRKFYNHSNGQTGSGLVRLQAPGGSTAAFVVVNGLDKTTSSGSAFIARYAIVSQVHGLLAAGAPGTANRVTQVPRIEIKHPTFTSEIENPASVTVRWSRRWKRWDDAPYTTAYPSTFAETGSTLRYVLMLSSDSGKTWKNLKDGSLGTPGRLPTTDGTTPDPLRTFPATSTSGDESWIWATPVAEVPSGAYMIRIEAYRTTEPLHYGYHMEKFYVDR